MKLTVVTSCDHLVPTEEIIPMIELQNRFSWITAGEWGYIMYDCREIYLPPLPSSMQETLNKAAHLLNGTFTGDCIVSVAPLTWSEHLHLHRLRGAKTGISSQLSLLDKTDTHQASGILCVCEWPWFVSSSVRGHVLQNSSKGGGSGWRESQALENHFKNSPDIIAQLGHSQATVSSSLRLCPFRSSSKRFAEQTAATVALLVMGIELPLIRTTSWCWQCHMSVMSHDNAVTT